MSLNVLAPLLLGGLGKRFIDDYFADRDRGILAEGIKAAMGEAPGSTVMPNPHRNEQIQPTAGSGLLADPTDPTNQLQFASSLAGLPGGEGMAQQLIRDVLGFEEASAAAGTQRKFVSGENQLDRQSREDIAAARILADLGVAGANGLPPGTEQGAIPSGYSRSVIDGQTVDVPNPGTNDYDKRVSELQTLETAVRDIDEMMTLLNQSGTEFFGAESGKQAVTYGQIISHIAKLRDLGVLQQGEAERLEEQLTDPSGLSGAVTRNETIRAQYNQLLKFFQHKLKDANQRYQYMGIGSQLDKTTPSQLREEQERIRRERAAAEQGLTVLQEAPPLQGTSDRSGPGVGDLLETSPLELGKGYFDIYRMYMGGDR